MTDSTPTPARVPTARRLPHLPGLDGMRALAVIAVMAYHANAQWLPGGFLGVEVFFVISGYLITLLLLAEHHDERRIDVGAFWMRRGRRLLPALFLLLSLLVVYLAALRPEAQGRTRGDLVAGLTYVSNWYQLWVGAGYTASEAFVPLRHLWSLAVEEQFYLFWPLVMVLLLRRRPVRPMRAAMALLVIAVGLHVAVAMLYVPGDIDSVCTPEAMHGYWRIAGRCISINDTLYLSTLSRAGGLLLGAALGWLWVPRTLMEGPWRTEGRQLDLLALIGVSVLALLMWRLHLSEPAATILTGVRFDPWLFRGGLLVSSVATLFVILAVTHPGALAGRVLGHRALAWVGTRSYGLYLFHWPIYQIIRGEAGVPMSPAQFASAIALTLPITECSYRLIELPVRQGAIRRWWRRDDGSARRFDLAAHWRGMTLGAVVGGAVLWASLSVARAPDRCLGEVECASQMGRSAIAAAARAQAAALPPSPSGIAVDDSTAVVATSATVDDVPPVDSAFLAELLASEVIVISRDTTTTDEATIPATEMAPADSTAETDSVGGGTAMVIPPFAIGESVMLGAAPQLQAGGVSVDAEVSRQGRATLRRLRQLKSEGRLGATVVLQVGTNGPVEMAVYDEIMSVLPAEDHPRVIFLTVYADRVWIASNNARIRSLANRFPHVEVLDWHGLVASGKVPGMASDSIHLGTLKARRTYARLILGRIVGRW